MPSPLAGARLSCFSPDRQILAVFQQKHHFAVYHSAEGLILYPTLRVAA